MAGMPIRPLHATDLMQMLTSLRRKVEQSDLLAQVSGRTFAGWAKLCDRSTTWRREGEEDVARAAAEGPVMMVLWHEMIMMGSVHWQPAWGRLVSLHDTSPAGRSGAAAAGWLGTEPFLMSGRQSNLGVTREILGLLRAGRSLAVTGDGPRGPRRVVKDAPLDWARAAGVPVFAYAWAVKGQRRAKSWDRMQLVRPFEQGGIVFRRWDREIPRRMDDATREALRADLGAHLTAAADAAAALAAGG
jgi:lysophospholipid acyltransferase (LPLAT)-like uncharacterized protein